MKKRLPPQTPECLRDAHAVFRIFPGAEAFYERSSGVVRIEAKLAEDPYEATLGIGCSSESAWADAARNVQRPPVPDIAARGSPTWSLKSDEVFWKGK